MKTILERDLLAVVRRINLITNSPETTYTMDKAGKFKANIGNYHLYHAYGGVSLRRMHSKGGGIIDVLNCGCVTKRELYNRMQSFIRGLEVIK